MNSRIRHIVKQGNTLRMALIAAMSLLTCATSMAQEQQTGVVVHGNVFGGGKGIADEFTCAKAMVGIEGNGETVANYPDGNATVTISKGTVDGNVYGGGEVSRVEMNTEVTIEGDNTIIKGSVFGAGAGIETHGYSALVRGTSTVTVQGSAEVWKNVYGGGEKASVGRYKVKIKDGLPTDAPATLPAGMPYGLKAGGTSTVTIQGSAVIGTDDDATTGHVYGAGQGIEPSYNNTEGNAGRSKRMVNYNSEIHTDGNVNDEWNFYVDEDGNVSSSYVWEYFTTKDAYLTYLETLALSAETDVTITGSATVKGSVFGGSESGFVYNGTLVKVQNGTINENVFGGGRGLESFAEAGRVRGNTNVTISNGTIKGNVYGGGNLGDVGTINKDDQTDYNYVWKNSAANGNVNATGNNNTPKNNTITGTNNNTGICTVTISGGEIGISGTESSEHGNVFGAGKGSEETWWCEKAIAYATVVSVSGSTVVHGNVYGGGQVGRVEDDGKVTIGNSSDTGEGSKPDIKGDVFGAGAGLATHGYSALLRGNAAVTVQGIAKVGGNVYGGGEIASVGRFTVPNGLPKEPLSGGDCTVTIKDNATIGTSSTGGNVYGACKGVDPATVSERKSMQLLKNAPQDATLWSHYDDDENSPFIWRYYSEAEYPAFLRTLALTSNPNVTIGATRIWDASTETESFTPSANPSAGTSSETPTVYGSVYGGGQRGITLGKVDVNIVRGIVNKDVYGGGALADTNVGNWDADGYTEVTGLTENVSSVTGLYTLSGTTYTLITDEDAKAASGTTYYSKGKWADAIKMTKKYKTTVDLLGGYIKGDAYGGGLGQKTGFNSASTNIPAVVWGDIDVTLDGTKFDITYSTDAGHTDVVESGRVFGCNNLLGSPQGDVTVTVERTVAGNIQRTTAANLASNKAIMDAHPGNYKSIEGYVPPTYEVAAVYGGGNLAPYTTTGKKAHVIINGCDLTSIETVYGGGNAAPVPETDVDVNGTYEIGAVFGGGNGKDKYKKGSNWVINPGADVIGNANTLIYGGTVHEAYGGSNEKGTVHRNVTIDLVNSGLEEGDPGYCETDVAQLVGAGKNADVNGDLKIIMGCKPSERIPLVFGGADNANVNGDVELTVTSGNFGKIFGGNNNGGRIKGHIILNIQETTCIPLNIEHLYLCGNNAAYSQYGYYVKTEQTEATNGNGIGATSETPILTSVGKLQLIPRESADDPHLPVDTYTYTYDEETETAGATWTVLSTPYAGYGAPVLNVTSCTSIGEVFGGGFGASATVYGNPTVNINMIPGDHADKIDRDGDDVADGNANALGTIGDVYGGGDAAAVYGNTTVNIGTATKVDVYEFAYDDENKKYELQYEADGVTPSMIPDIDVAGAYITGNVYGGGKLADVGKYHEVDDAVVADRKNAVIDLTGNTNVNIGAKLNNSGNWESVAEGTAGVFIGGNVYGGGMGDDTSFFCDAAMVLGNKGTTESSNDTNNDGGGTHVRIGNGTINGNVYGGGEIARVERNTEVTIGFGEGVPGTPTTNKPVIMGTVFGAGAGLRTHGYSALVRGHSSVTIEGNAKVMQSVYGGGEMATVGRYQVTNNIAEYNISGGKSTVTIGGYAEIGPDDMKMDNGVDEQGKPLPPDDYGHVFGAGKGAQPYEGFKDTEQPWSMQPNGKAEYKKFSELVGDEKLPNNYVTYLRTLALTTETDVTIKDHAFIKGCVFGGSENGFVQEDTHVKIQDNCQIGNGYVQMKDDGTYLATANMRGVNRRYTAKEWKEGRLFPESDPDYTTGTDTDLEEFVSENNYYTSSLPECASWPYGQKTGDDKYAPYDKNALSTGYYDAGGTKTAAGGRPVGDDGHTFYGSVFGGGSGYYPYKPGRWFEDAGAVYGNARVDITGGHILTSVYGGNELTNVGKYQLDSDGKPTTKITSGGKCTITMSGGTVGVPRTLKQIGAHPVTCYLFGAGKGDQRVLFNKSTNVGDVEVNIKGGTIYGSVFGGGEDGHVMRDVKVTIENTTVPAAGEGESPTTITPTIGTWGTSYVDGNVFGGGRGFSGDAYTAGNVAGSIQMEIKGGNILGSIYGGGRLGSVGYGLFESTNTANYGVMQDDNKDDEGNTTNFYKEGDVGLGRGHIDITISGGTIGNGLEYIIPNATNMAEANIPESYRDISKWDDDNNYWTQWKEYHKIPKTEFDTTTGRLTHTKGGNVFVGGMGNFYKQDGQTPISDVNWWQLGCAKSTKLTITGGTIMSCVYGGGELGQVVGYHTTDNVNLGSEITIQGSNTVIGTEVKDGSNVTQYTFGSVFGGGYGSLMEKITHTGGKPDSYPKYIAGRVKAGTKVNMTAGSVLASVYGGGEMAAVGESKTLGETLTTGHSGDTYVSVSGGTVGIAPITISGSNRRYFGGAKMGNVYGGGSGHGNTVRSGHVYGNTNVTISAGSVSGEPNIYHNVYGGGAYGSVGDFTYQTGTDAQTGTQKVIGISGLNENHSNSGVATVTITGGTIGYDGKENGMVFGSSRGDINEPGARDDHTAWVYNTHVTIGTSGTSGSETGPQINGTVYGSGENGHTFNNTVVTVNGGTIGIDDKNDDGFTVTSNGTTYEGAAYPYRGNVYGGGCGTDKYYSNHALETHDGNGQLFNPLAGIVYGTTTVTINDGHVVRNVYGAGAMGSVGRTVTTTNTDNTTTTTYSGGTTTINVSGGTIGVSGTVGDGNVFGAARGDLSATGDYISQVRNTNVTVSGGQVKGSVYGGGELGDVGTIDKSDQTDYNYIWKDKDGNTNAHCNNTITGTNNNTGICTVTVSGGMIGTDVTTMNADGSFDNGNVFGGGKGSGTTWWCEKAIAYSTNVNVSAGMVKGSVYGGGEVGRVEDDAKVTIGSATGTEYPTIIGSVFGAGKGLKTHGYSALVRGNADVTVQGKSVIGGSVFGGGEIASVGKFFVDKGLPKKPLNGGTCTVRIQDEAKIGSSGTGHNVFGACKGVKSTFDLNNYTNFKSMQTEANGAKGTEGTDWDYYETYPQNYTGHKFVWKYYTTENAYLAFLRTLALTSNTHVTIDETATVYGSVFGGGERGVTLGGVDVNIVGGTVKEDVYGGGSLADSNAAMWDAETNERVAYVELDKLIPGTSATGYYSSQSPNALITAADATVQSNTTYYAVYKTNVNLHNGTIVGNAYGGGLGQLAKDAVAAVLYTAEDAEVIAGTKQVGDVKTPAQPAVDAVEAKVYGDVLVELNKTTDSDNCVIGSLVNANDPTSRNGNVFGCNNLNGSPQAGVTVHIHKTAHNDNKGSVATNKPTKNSGNYELQAVYGGGNLAAYYPDDETMRAKAMAYVTIDGCDKTSIGSVYGGGNAASVPATEVVVNGTWEIGEAFGGGNGKDDVSYNGTDYVTNPGANVGYRAYPDGTSLQDRATYAYGLGKSHITIYGGTVHKVYGGSNTKGNVRVESRTTLEDRGCNFNVGQAYGGGNNAPQDGDAVLEIGCISGMDKAYGGASNADVNGDVVLNITNGTYGRVFGGNDLGGLIRGSITVNIEETGCRPIIIGELYGGGNLARYSVYGYNDDGSVKETGDNPVPDPVLNVKSFTSIGNIYGGGYGGPATMVGSPEVNINVLKGKYAETYKGSPNDIGDNARIVGSTVTNDASVPGYESGYPIPSHAAGAIGAINNVFGGGNAANVIGTPHVNVGTLTGEVITLASKPIEDSEGKLPSDADWIPSYQIMTVEGADIRGNVFGGGNNAEVTGDTEVVIGKNNSVKTYSFTSYSEGGTAGTAWSSGLAQTTGVMKEGNAEVVILTNGKFGNFVGQKYYIDPNAPTDGTRTELKDASGHSLSPQLYVSIEQFKQKTYTFTSYGAQNGGTPYSTDGTATATGNFKIISINGSDTKCMQIQVLTNPGFEEWVGRTFYVPLNATTDGNTRYQLYKANGTAENVWVTIKE